HIFYSGGISGAGRQASGVQDHALVIVVGIGDEFEGSGLANYTEVARDQGREIERLIEGEPDFSYSAVARNRADCGHWREGVADDSQRGIGSGQDSAERKCSS